MKIADTSGQDVVLNPKTKKKTWIVSGLMLLIIISVFVIATPTISSWSSSDTSISSDRIRIATVQRGDLIRDLSVQGRVVAAVSPRLYATGQGTITFKVDAGDEVAKGQELAVIDSPELTNQLKQEQVFFLIFL